jgi:hypothetical protein
VNILSKFSNRYFDSIAAIVLTYFFSPSKAEIFSQFDPNPRATKVPGIKFTMELLLKLFHEHIKKQFPLTYCGLSLLKGLEGKHETLFKASKNKHSVIDGIKFGTSNQHGFFPVAVKSDYPLPGSILKKSMLFSTFVHAVLSDAINLDDSNALRLHCKSNSEYLSKLTSMKTKCTVKAGYNADKTEQTKNSQLAQQVNFARQKIVSMVKGDTKDLGMQLLAFRFLQESKLIKNVTVHDAGLKMELAEALNEVDENGNFKSPEPENGTVIGVSLVDLLPGFGNTFKAHKEQRKKEKEEKKKKGPKKKGEFPSLTVSITNSTSFDDGCGEPVNQTPAKKGTYHQLTQSPPKRKTPTAETNSDIIAMLRAEQAVKEKKRKEREQAEKEAVAKKAKVSQPPIQSPKVPSPGGGKSEHGWLLIINVVVLTTCPFS